MYGLECKQICGNCINKEQCHHVNGSCLNGCDNGFYGTRCDLGMLKSIFALVYSKCIKVCISNKNVDGLLTSNSEVKFNCLI